MADGTYYPDEGDGMADDDRTASFVLRDTVSIYGGFAGGETSRNERDPASHSTVLSGNIDQDPSIVLNSLHVIRNDSSTAAVTSDTILAGVTITAGNADASSLDGMGGGMLLDGSQAPTLVNVNFSGNNAINSGGAVYLLAASASFDNTVFTTNSVTDTSGSPLGGAMMAGGGGTVSVTNSTFKGNNSPGDAAALYVDSNGSVRNSVFWGNNSSSGTSINLDGTSSIRFAIIQGGASEITTVGASGDPTTESISESDPLLTPNGALSPGSPAIDAGDQTLLSADFADLDGDGDSVEALPLDRRGLPRVVGSEVDLGAYERQ